MEAGEMSQHLKVLVALLKNPRSILSTHMTAHNCNSSRSDSLRQNTKIQKIESLMDILSKTNKSTPPLVFGDIVCVALDGLKSTM